MKWLPSALFALFSFGLWGVFSKLAVMHIDSKSVLIYQTLGVMVIAAIILYFMPHKIMVDSKGVTFGLLTGLAYGTGCLFYLLAIDKGKLITVVTITALYPLVTILLSYVVLKETVSLKQSIGIVCGLISIILLSS